MTDESRRTVEQRLEAQARAIRDLRARVAALESGRPSAPIRTSDSPGELVPLGSVGVYVNNLNCLGCGQRKEEGRLLALCRTCASERNQTLQAGDPVRYHRCGNCGKDLNGTSMPLCGKCGPAYAAWRKGT